MTPQTLIFCIAAAGMFGLGLYGVLAYRHLLRKILALNIIGNAVFLLLVALAGRDPTTTDPIPHAMVLTGIVITVCATAFALTLTRCLYRDTGKTDLIGDE